MTNDIRDFQDILTDLDDGHVHEELTRVLRDVVRGVREANAAGSITLKISLKPEGRQFVVNADVTSKIPTRKPSASVFFATDDGDLRKDDPKQVPLRNVDTKPHGRVLREVEFNIDAPKGA